MTVEVKFIAEHDSWSEQLTALPEVGSVLVRTVEVIPPGGHPMLGFQEETWEFRVQSEIKDRFTRSPTFRLLKLQHAQR